jgi:hypothetical protein
MARDLMTQALAAVNRAGYPAAFFRIGDGSPATWHAGPVDALTTAVRRHAGRAVPTGRTRARQAEARSVGDSVSDAIIVWSQPDSSCGAAVDSAGSNAPMFPSFRGKARANSQKIT